MSIRLDDHFRRRNQYEIDIRQGETTPSNDIRVHANAGATRGGQIWSLHAHDVAARDVGAKRVVKRSAQAPGSASNPEVHRNCNRHSPDQRATPTRRADTRRASKES